jgi:16S rRNA (guanine966-N2)-methyltransferase
MRVIAGEFRGRKLSTPEGLNTRPILDRVKGALFDWLGSRLALPGSLPAVNVCDLFCGGGSQGIEAISRGAAFAAFVETQPDALKCLRENIATLKIANRGQIVNRPAESAVFKTPDGRGFSIIFVDPPYRLSEDLSPASVMGRVVARIGKEIRTEPDAIVAWRHDESCRLPTTLPNGWVTIDRRTWGSNAITMFSRAENEAAR